MSESPEIVKDLNLGELQTQFLPSRLHQSAGYIMAVLIFVCGSFFLITAATELFKHFNQFPVVGGDVKTLLCLSAGCIFGLGMLIGSVLLFRWLRSVDSLSVFLGENGYCVMRNQRVEVYLWSQIAYVMETVTTESPPLLVPPLNLILPKVTSRSFVIYRYGGKEFGFDKSYLKDHAVFADLVKQKTDQRGILWKVIEFHD